MSCYQKYRDNHNFFLASDDNEIYFDKEESIEQRQNVRSIVHICFDAMFNIALYKSIYSTFWFDIQLNSSDAVINAQLNKNSTLKWLKKRLLSSN